MEFSEFISAPSHPLFPFSLLLAGWLLLLLLLIIDCALHFQLERRSHFVVDASRMSSQHVKRPRSQATACMHVFSIYPPLRHPPPAGGHEKRSKCILTSTSPQKLRLCFLAVPQESCCVGFVVATLKAVWRLSALGVENPRRKKK